jgi:hypothetical protein
MNTAQRAALGLGAGLVATALMSAHMIAEPSTAKIGTPPPRRLADTLFPASRLAERKAAATLIHLSIGAASGVIYRGLFARRRGGLLSGAVFGVAVWAVGYELVIPALGVLPPAHRDQPGRTAALLQAHLIYGAALGALS